MNGKKLPLICFTINAFDVFNETFPRLSDIFTTLFRDAPKCGVIFIVSVSSTTSLRQRQLQYFNHLIVMQLKDDSMYRSLTNCRRGLIPKNYNGRGICKINEVDNDSYDEFQTALIAPAENEIEIIKKYANYCCNYYIYKVKQLVKIPENITSNDLIKYISTLNDVPLGFDLVNKNIVKYNLLNQKINLISGKSINDYANFIVALANLLSHVPNTKIRMVDMSSVVKIPSLDIKLFNKDFDLVMAALEKDAINRKETDAMAINIIVGIGSYKKKLSKAGVLIFESLFSKIASANKTTYILIDNYDEMRGLKIEDWYTDLDTRGIWLGSGVGTQSLFNSTSVSNDDKKYDFTGLAYLFEESNYTVMKIMMDGDK